MNVYLAAHKLILQFSKIFRQENVYSNVHSNHCCMVMIVLIHVLRSAQVILTISLIIKRGHVLAYVHQAPLQKLQPEHA